MKAFHLGVLTGSLAALILAFLPAAKTEKTIGQTFKKSSQRFYQASLEWTSQVKKTQEASKRLADTLPAMQENLKQLESSLENGQRVLNRRVTDLQRHASRLKPSESDSAKSFKKV